MLNHQRELTLSHLTAAPTATSSAYFFNTPVSAATGLNRFFALGTVKGDEPRRAVVLTYVIAQSAIFIGGLDAVAPILTK